MTRVLLAALVLAGAALGQEKADPPRIKPQNIPVAGSREQKALDETPRTGGVIATQPGEELRGGFIWIPGRPGEKLGADVSQGPAWVEFVRGLADADRAGVGRPTTLIVGKCMGLDCGKVQWGPLPAALPGGVHPGYYQAPQAFAGWQRSGGGCANGQCGR